MIEKTRKPFKRTRVGRGLKKVITAPGRMIGTAVRKERAYNKFKADKFQEELKNSL